MTGYENRIYKEAIRTLRELIESVIKEEGVVVYLFGSRATGNATTVSDIDIGIAFKDRSSRAVIPLLREKIENSNIPYKVDIVDLSQVSREFRERVLREGKVLWRS